MHLVTFDVPTPVGPIRRLGVSDETGEFVDLTAGYEAVLSERMDPGRACAIAAATLPPDLIGVLAAGSAGREAIEEVRAHVGGLGPEPSGARGERLIYEAGSVQVLAPVPRPTSLRDCAAFEQHVHNTMGDRPIPDVWFEQPLYYKGNPAAVVGTGVDVRAPSYARWVDFEAEFAVVIGRAGRDLSEAEALNHVGGYTVFNDVSARREQFREQSFGLGPAKGKDFDTANVLGPALVTPDAFDPRDGKAVIVRVNGEEWNRGSTDAVHHSVARIVSHISTSETLHVGDVIGVGTVGGGSALELGRRVADGDVVEIEVEGLGVLRNRFTMGPV